MKIQILIVLAVIVLAHASHASDVTRWLEHENVREGVPAAYKLCLVKKIPSATITFSFEDRGVPSLLTLTCQDIIDYVDSKEPITA